jgi:hypothetical protein
MKEMSEMFPGNPRESMVAALQLAGGDTEKAAELVLSGELFDDRQVPRACSVVVLWFSMTDLFFNVIG